METKLIHERKWIKVEWIVTCTVFLPCQGVAWKQSFPVSHGTCQKGKLLP